MTNKELVLFEQLMEVAKTVSELKAENKILKEIIENLITVQLSQQVLLLK